jgi:hypothetical protein
MRYVVIPNHYSLGRTPKISFQVVDVDAGCTPQFFPKRVVASCADEGMAQQIANHFNGVNNHASYWQAAAETARTNALALEKRWQATLDHTNGLLSEARKSADILSKQLFEAHEQQYEARDALKVAEAGEVNMRLEAARALTELAALRKQRDSHVCSPPVYGPFGHVVLSIEQYDKLVKERDEAIAKYEACVDTVSFVDGRWVKTV